MKFFGVILCSCFVLLSANYSEKITEVNELRDIFDGFINDTINKIIEGLEDPININDTLQHFNNMILTGWLNLSEFHLIGLKSIVASDIKVKYNLLNPSSINLTVTVEKLDLFSNYDTSLLIGQLVPYFGTGNITANLDNFKLNIFTLANVHLVPVSIDGFANSTIDISIGDGTNITIQGILRNDDLSKHINDFLHVFMKRFIDFVNSSNETISRVLSPIFQAILDKIFNKVENY